MIWYLLYPFRGTSEAPVLEPTHPFRSAFTRYGTYAARHVVTTLLISVTVAFILVYPFPFLYSTESSNGASNLPHHVWTDAQPVEDKNGIEADVIMRSIWVHGSYMQALEKDVLLGALELQDQLLGPTADFNPRQPLGAVEVPDPTSSDLAPKQRDAFHVVNGLTNQSWFFHSPLQYWSCSAEVIAQDNDIVGTVNARKTQPTSVNVTLRHSIVFSGKRFEDRRLVAADALVVTLIHLRDSPIGRLWEQRAKVLAEKMADKWQVYIADEPSSRDGQLYEFQFRPMSIPDGLGLGVAYLLTLIYCLISLSKLRAVKSKVGLMVTVVVQICLSMMSSFTICAIFKVDLSRIPSFSYPIAIFSLSLENVFRLINSVILTPSEDSTSNRVGYAFGETAHVALASVVQNLSILYGLSKLVSPGVSAFCTFAAIALIVDFFYLSTFFLAVLSVDVRRTELCDALAKASLRRSRRSSSDPQTRQSWIDATLQGRIALSTRIAGTIVTVGFVLIAQWHFFESQSVMRTLSRIFRISSEYKELGTPHSSLLVDVHQARSPTSWLRLQDHETAREVIHVIKPDAHSYIARVFHPLVFVLKGSDRMPSTRERLLPPAVYDFIRHHSVHFAVILLVIGAAVRLLMNYLLWDELAETTGVSSANEAPLLSVRTLEIGHALDVALMAASSDGHIISVGLDRLIRVWDVKSGGDSYVLLEQDDTSTITFPILAMCIDDESHWLALLTRDKILVWNLCEHRWAPTIQMDPHRQKPEAFLFYHDQSKGISLLLFRREGVLIEVNVDEGTATTFNLAEESAIVSVGSLTNKIKGSTKIMTSTREGQAYSISKKGSSWDAAIVELPRMGEREYLSTVALPDLSSFLVIHCQSVDLVDSQSQKVVRSFETDPIQPKTFKCFHSRPRRQQCGSIGVRTLTFAYLNAYTRDLVVQTYSPQYEGDSLCFCSPDPSRNKTCFYWPNSRETKRRINDPGVWDALPSRILIGIRRKRLEKPPALGSQPHPPPPKVANVLRHRRRGRSSGTHSAAEIRAQGDWEVWMFSQHGKQETWETAPLCPNAEDVRHLYVTNLGPMVRLGRCSVAIGFSNVIKVIVVGQERFDRGDDTQLGDGMPAIGSRKRKGQSTAMRSRHSLPADSLT
ncbi:hypothetical protein DL764_005686 [Monosporascus ibericus]|uniref:Sterol regulatory element-binding protein cleavage-activating protein n=1 Tax=Monosporascus ibericus TaxID=155417 RepID=A0A4Q4T806_9PEZI|nr:hypothetical protein DL764_005686 [Monosporascus ibericus]